MSTHHAVIYVGLKNPRSVRVDVTVEIRGQCHLHDSLMLDCDTSDFDPRLFEAEWSGIGAKIIKERT